MRDKIDKVVALLFPDSSGDEWKLEQRSYEYEVIHEKENSIIVVPYKVDSKKNAETGEVKDFKYRKSIIPKRIKKSSVRYRGKVNIDRRTYMPRRPEVVESFSNEQPAGQQGIKIDSEDVDIEGNKL